MNLPIAPLAAAVLGGLALLGVVVMPTATLEALVMDSGLPAVIAAAEPPLGLTARLAVGLASGAMVAVTSWLALFVLFGTRGVTLGGAAPAVGSDTVAAPVVRRADAHPDAPPRPPLLATRDLGDPFPTRPLRPLRDAAPGERVAAAAPLPAEPVFAPIPTGIMPAPAAPVAAIPTAPVDEVDTLAVPRAPAEAVNTPMAVDEVDSFDTSAGAMAAEPEPQAGAWDAAETGAFTGISPEVAPAAQPPVESAAGMEQVESPTAAVLPALPSVEALDDAPADGDPLPLAPRFLTVARDEAPRGLPLGPGPAAPLERPLPRDLEQPLAAFDPRAIPAIPLPTPVLPTPLQRPAAPAALGPRERFETFELKPPVPPTIRAKVREEAITRPETEASIHALLERLERGVVRQTGAEHPAPAAQPRRREAERGLEEALVTLRNLARQA